MSGCDFMTGPLQWIYAGHKKIHISVDLQKELLFTTNSSRCALGFFYDVWSI